MVHPEVWNKVPDGHVCEAKPLRKHVQYSGHGQETEVAQHNELGVFGLVQRTRRIEVVDPVSEAVLLALATALNLPFVLVVTRHVGGEIPRPAHELLPNQKHGRI
jgi:hypothetical protein